MQTQVFSRPRSIRIAFLVDINEDIHPILDAIFSYSFSIWGGRFSIIIPCENGSPLSAYLPWLERYDPDFIYSYVDLSEEVQFKLHELLYPSILQYHFRNIYREQQFYIPQLEVSPLRLETILPMAGAPNFFTGGKGIKVIDAMGSVKLDRFLLDSFGCASANLRNSMNSLLSEYGSTIIAIADQEFTPRQYYIRESEAVIPSVNHLLSEMKQDKRIFSVAQLSSMFTSRLSLNSHRWSNSFNIVIGDEITDRILYWNVRSLTPAWLDGRDFDLCIPREKFNDPGFVLELRDYLNQRNHINPNGNNGPYRATLRSTSLSSVELEELVSILQSENNWISYRHEYVTDISECIPNSEELERISFSRVQNTFTSSGDWSESFSTGDSLRLNAVQPDHIRYVPAVLASLKNGSWAIDLDIERAVDHSPYSNVTHRWRLPRRLRVTNAFIKAYQIALQGDERVTPRISTGGFLTVYAAGTTSLPAINIPTDYVAIVTALEAGRNWASFKRTPVDINEGPAQICYSSSQSNAGKYFWGVFQLFGDINTVCAFLLHKFWRKQLESFEATDQRTDERQERMRNKLLQRIGARNLNLDEPYQLDTLSDIILQEADALRVSVRTLNFKKFEKDFKMHVENFYISNPIPDNMEFNLTEETQYYLDGLHYKVQNLCGLNVLHQGYEHKCNKCLHRSWIGIADLKQNIVCEVCHESQLAPIDRPWEFRLNGFLREALRRYGIGPLFWVLNHFQKNSDQSFWFEGPLNIYFDQDAAHSNKPDTDIDLTIIENGVVRMCEVKQSARQFKDPVHLAKNMLRLRPDIATIAIMEADSAEIQRKFKLFSDVFIGTGVTPDLLTLDQTNSLEDAPWF